MRAIRQRRNLVVALHRRAAHIQRSVRAAKTVDYRAFKISVVGCRYVRRRVCYRNVRGILHRRHNGHRRVCAGNRRRALLHHGGHDSVGFRLAEHIDKPAHHEYFLPVEQPVEPALAAAVLHFLHQPQIRALRQRGHLVVALHRRAAHVQGRVRAAKEVHRPQDNIRTVGFRLAGGRIGRRVGRHIRRSARRRVRRRLRRRIGGRGRRSAGNHRRAALHHRAHDPVRFLLAQQGHELAHHEYLATIQDRAHPAFAVAVCNLLHNPYVRAFRERGHLVIALNRLAAHVQRHVRSAEQVDRRAGHIRSIRRGSLRGRVGWPLRGRVRGGLRRRVGRRAGRRIRRNRRVRAGDHRRPLLHHGSHHAVRFLLAEHRQEIRADKRIAAFDRHMHPFFADAVDNLFHNPHIRVAAEHRHLIISLNRRASHNKRSGRLAKAQHAARHRIGRIGRGLRRIHRNRHGGNIKMERFRNPLIVRHNHLRGQRIRPVASVNDIAQHCAARWIEDIRMVRVRHGDGQRVQRGLRIHLRPEGLIVAPFHRCRRHRRNAVAARPRQRDHQFLPIFLCRRRPREHRQHHRHRQKHRQETVRTRHFSVFHDFYTSPQRFCRCYHIIVYPQAHLVNESAPYGLRLNAGKPPAHVQISKYTEVFIMTEDTKLIETVIRKEGIHLSRPHHQRAALDGRAARSFRGHARDRSAQRRVRHRRCGR